MLLLRDIIIDILKDIHVFITVCSFSVCPTACAGHCEDCFTDLHCTYCEAGFRVKDKQPIKCQSKQLVINSSVHIMLITTAY